jgi:hypothetical protein
VCRFLKLWILSLNPRPWHAAGGAFAKGKGQSDPRQGTYLKNPDSYSKHRTRLTRCVQLWVDDCQRVRKFRGNHVGKLT